jgi:hypothetical protein
MFPVRYKHHLRITSKGIPVTGRGGVKCCGMLKITQCSDSRLTDGGEVATLTNRPRSIPQKHYFPGSDTRIC